MCDQWANKQTVNESHWLIGKDMLAEGEALRSLGEQGTGYPSDKQVSRIRDYHTGMYIHYGSGIPDKAFYLTSVKVGGYSSQKVGKIWYIALKDRLSDYSKFQDAADITYDIAGSLFGRNSKEQEAVIEGWEGVYIAPKIPVAVDITKIITEKRNTL